MPPLRRFLALLAVLFLLLGLAGYGGRTSPARAARGVTITQDVPYAQPGGVTLRLDAFVPDGTALVPGVIAIHGGGFVLGEKEEWDNNCRELAMDGFACFSIDYRLAPDHPYPAAVEDATAAVEWLRQNAADYHVDPKRLGVIGSSAGAHLAAMIGYMGNGSLDTGTRVRLVVLWSPVADVASLLPDRDNVNETHANVHDFLDCDLTRCADRMKEASPVTYVDASDAPTFIANSTDELIPVTQAEELSRVLKDAGVPRELHLVDGTKHGARLKNQFPQGEGTTVWDLSVAFIQKWIDAGSTPSSPAPVPSGTLEADRAPPAADGTLFTIVAAVGVAVVLGMVGIPLLRRRRLR